MAKNNKDEITKSKQPQQSNVTKDDKSPKKKDKPAASEEITKPINSRKTSPGTSQRDTKNHTDSLDADFEELPSQKRVPGSNLTGPGLG